MAGPPRHDPGAGQGRHPLPPRRRRRRGEGAGGDDDVQDRDPRPALRRRQGRRAVRPARAVARRARAADPPLHLRDQPAARPRDRHPGARRQHRRPGDGVADGHAVDDPGPRTCPASVTGKPLSIGGTRAHAGATSSGCLVCARAAFRGAGHPDGGQPGRASRASARSAGRWRSCSLGRHAGGRGERHRRRRANEGGLDVGALSDHVAETGSVAGFAAARRSARGADLGHRVRAAGAGRARRRASTAVVAERIAGRGDRRGGQRADDHRGPGGARRAGHRRRARHPRQRRRRDGLLLRVGAERGRATRGRSRWWPSACGSAWRTPSSPCGPGPRRWASACARAAYVVALERVAAAIAARGLFP